MPTIEELYPGRFLRKEVLKSPKTIRIVGVTRTELEGERGAEMKVTVRYKSADGDGELVLAKTNAILIAAALDERDADKWVGRLVTIHHDPDVTLGKRKVGGIRVCGSPELKAPKRVEVKRPRRSRPEVYELVPTDKQGRPSSAGATEPTKPEGAGE